MVDRTAGGVTDGEISVQKILKICQKSIRLIPYVSMHFHCNGVICLGTHSAHICIATAKLIWTRMAVRYRRKKIQN